MRFMHTLLAEVNTDLVKNLSLGVVGVSAVLALIVMKVVSSIVSKAILLVLLVALGIGAYSQRASINDCAKRIEAVYEQGSPPAGTKAECTFLGKKVKVPVSIGG